MRANETRGQQAGDKKMATATRAKAGGEVGMNGEFYAGGTFLPNTKLGKMSLSKPAGNRPARTILDQVFGLVAVDSTYAPTFAKVTANDQALAYYGFTRQQVEDIVARFNAGER
jgi:hypothetical protein